MSKRQLVVMRHAKSSWTTDAKTDHERPLNKRGQRDAPRVAAHLASLGVAPQIVISSDSKRTRQTWAGMKTELGDIDVTFTHALFHAGYAEVREALAALPDRVTSAMVIGHNPGWEEVVAALSSEHLVMTTANAVILSGKGETWSDALDRTPWSIDGVVRPKEL